MEKKYTLELTTDEIHYISSALNNSALDYKADALNYLENEDHFMDCMYVYREVMLIKRKVDRLTDESDVDR